VRTQNHPTPDPPYARCPSTRASAPQLTASEVAGSGTDSLRLAQRVQVTSSIPPGSWATATQLTRRVMPYGRQRPRCYREGARAGVLTQQAQFHARSSGGRDECASHTGPCIPVEPAHVRAPWNGAGARTERHLLQTLYSLNPERLAPTQLPHLTCRRAVTGQLTGHVRMTGSMPWFSAKDPLNSAFPF
jgi:hypothetical protein